MSSEDTPVKDIDGDKDEKKDDDDTEAKSIWESFRESIKEIGNFSDNFLAALKNAPISSKTRKDISNKLKDYKDLLQETKDELQSQRQKAQKLSNTFDNMIFFLFPDKDIVEEALKDLSKEEKQKEVESFSSDFCCH